MSSAETVWQIAQSCELAARGRRGRHRPGDQLGGGDQGDVAVSAEPGAALEVVQAQVGPQFAVVKFDPPADCSNSCGRRGSVLSAMGVSPAPGPRQSRQLGL